MKVAKKIILNTLVAGLGVFLFHFFIGFSYPYYNTTQWLFLIVTVLVTLFFLIFLNARVIMKSKKSNKIPPPIQQPKQQPPPIQQPTTLPPIKEVLQSQQQFLSKSNDPFEALSRLPSRRSKSFLDLMNEITLALDSQSQTYISDSDRQYKDVCQKLAYTDSLMKQIDMLVQSKLKPTWEQIANQRDMLEVQKEEYERRLGKKQKS